MEHYVKIMEAAGFEVQCEVADYPATLGTEWWYEQSRPSIHPSANYTSLI